MAYKEHAWNRQTDEELLPDECLYSPNHVILGIKIATKLNLNVTSLPIS